MEVCKTPQTSIEPLMEISYKKLWHLLIDKNMTKSDLQKATKMGWGSIAKLNRGENIGTDLLLRICSVLQCDIADIMEIDKSQNRK